MTLQTPINHHYVSQCQQRKFFNVANKKIYVYDKILKNHFSKTSTKTLFSENNLNSKFEEDKIDNKTLEIDLKSNFEDHYNQHLKVIESVISNPKNPVEGYTESINYLVRYGIIGDIRNPAIKKEHDDLIKDTLLLFTNDDQKKEILNIFNRTKYSNQIIYSDFSQKAFDKMGEVWCIFNAIESDDFFLLPDTSSLINRLRINNYYNPDAKDIAMVGIPLTSKIFMHAQSKKINDLNNHKIARLRKGDVRQIDHLNLYIFNYSNRYVACENEEYLKLKVSTFTQDI